MRWVDLAAGEWSEVDDVDVGVEMVGMASALWALVDPDRARAIDAVMARANERPGLDVWFEREDCLDLAELLPGLEPALAGRGVTTTVGDLLAEAFADAAPERRLREAILTVRAIARLFQRAAAEHLDVLDLR